jgi:chorismate synthase
LPLTIDDFLLKSDIERRKGSIQKATTPRQETDLPIFKRGVFNHHTTVAPLTILFENNNTRSGDYDKQRAIPRLGHADFVALQKFGRFEDYRGGGHFSGRLTVEKGFNYAVCYADDKNILEDAKYILPA